MFLPYQTFQRHYGAKGKVSKFFVRVDKVTNVAAVADTIRDRFPDLDIITRADGARFLSAALGTMRRIGGIWLGGAVLLAGAMILFAMLLAGDERIHELGTLKAVGASTGNLAVALVSESVLLAGLGAALGGLLYVALGEALGPVFFKATFGVYLPGHYGDSLMDNMLVSYALSPTLVVVLVVAMALAGGFGSLYALYKAHRLSPAEVGFVFQAFNLIPNLTALENAMLPAEFAGISGKQARRLAEGLLERVGLSGRKRHRPGQLSGGEQQRVAIARALINDPALVIADEPTGNLDTRTGAAIAELLTSLAGEQTVIIATDDERIADAADRVIHLADGRIESDEAEIAGNTKAVE